MKKLFFFLFFSSYLTAMVVAQERLNVELLGQYDSGGARYSGCWAYIDEAGREYALLGQQNGVSVFNIDGDIEKLGFVSGPDSRWREITVLGHYAYVTTEGASDTTGMQIIDLSGLPERFELVNTYRETFTRGHILQKDIYSDAPYIYINGTTSTQGVHILDISNPTQPQEVGLYRPEYYIHDCHVKGDLLFAAAFYEGTMDVVDISDKTNPVLITRIDDPGGFTHSSWLSEDDHYLFVCSERDGLPARIYNIEDWNNVEEVAQYTANTASLVHNPYIRGDYAFISHNTEGLRVVDIKDPKIPVEVGYYDTYTGESGGFNGLWSACPFFPSGKIIGGNREDGLYVWAFENVAAARVYATVEDSITGAILPQTRVVVLETGEQLNLNQQAAFSWGQLAGKVTLEFSLAGYFSKTVTIDLKAGEDRQLTFKLLRNPAPNFTDDSERSYKDLTVFPNPGLEKAHVALSDFPSAYQLEVYHADGRRVAVYPALGRERITIFRDRLGGSGVYELILRNRKKIIGCGRLVFP